MKFNTKKQLKRVLIVIKKFGNTVNVEYVKTKGIRVEKGEIIREKETKIPLKITVLNKSSRYGLRKMLENSKSIYDYDYDGFYCYDNNEVKELKQNDILYINDTRFRVDKTENNYKIFQRLELIKDEKYD